MEKKQIQIDVKNVSEITGIVHCNLYTSERCVQMFLSYEDYRNLVLDGFFLRDGDERDSANVLNTTDTYYTK